MTTPRRRGASLALRLGALVLVPVMALGVFAAQRIQSELDDADRAGDVAAAVDLQRHISAVYPPAQLEKVALEGLARMDALGLQRELIVAIIGVDFESTYEENSTALERSLDELLARHGQQPMQDGSLLGSRLSRIRGALDVQRGLSADGLARSDEVSAVFDDLFALLEEALRTETAVGVAGDIDPMTIQLDELTSVLVTAGDHSEALLGSILFGWSTEADAADTAHAVAHDRHEVQLDRFRATLPEPDPTFEDVVRLFDEIAGNLPTAASDGSPAPIGDPGVLSGLADTLLANLGYTTALDAYAADFADRIAAAADEAAAEANSLVTWTVVVLATVVVVSAGVLLFVLLSVLMPVRELTRRASRISSGELDSDPLPIRGPGDIRALTSTMNEMSATLHRVNEQIDRLAGF